MTLSRWDNQSALYSFANPGAYPRAFWHPGISPWQWDDASLYGLTASQRIDSRFIANHTARTMADRWCATPTTAHVWAPWFACNGGACTSIYNEIYQGGKLVNLDRATSVGRYGGMQARTCTNGTSATFTCWYIDPALAQGHTGWAQPGAGPAPITEGFYSFSSGGSEHRHWLRADTGYAIDIRARLPAGIDSRVGLVWSRGSQLCDLTTGRGNCDTLPAGFSRQSTNVSGTYSPVVGDFGGDGYDDILWYGRGTAADSLWKGSAAGTFTVVQTRIDGTYTPIGGDFDGDGRGDILWYGLGTAADAMWFGVAGGGFEPGAVDVSGTYTPRVGDFDGDGHDDIFWYGPGTARDGLWFGRDNGFTTRTATVNGTYRSFTGDFDGDRRDDIFWYAPGATKDSIWAGRADRTFQIRSSNVDGEYVPVAGDYNADRRTDVLWYGPGTKGDAIWYGVAGGGFSGGTVRVQGTFAPFTGDFSGNRSADIFWYGSGSAHDVIWRTG
jgi:hypothetical protein